MRLNEALKTSGSFLTFVGLIFGDGTRRPEPGQYRQAAGTGAEVANAGLAQSALARTSVRARHFGSPFSDCFAFGAGPSP